MILDLTLEISEQTQVFPGSPYIKVLQWSNFDAHSYVSEVLFATTHVGTHIDAPFHFTPNGDTVEKIQLNRLVINNNIKTIRIDKRDDELIEVDDLNQYDIKKTDTVLINTDWIKNNKDKKYFTKNPGLSKNAANYLAELHINLIGIDTPSIDPGLDKEFNSHKILLGNNIPIIENLNNIDKILNKKFTFIALPLKLKDCSGAPIRAVAVMDEGKI